MTIARALFLAAAAAGLAGLPAQAATNIMPTATVTVTTEGVHGVLRSAVWEAGSTPSDPLAPVDGVRRPETTQWNNGTFWWDAFPGISSVPVTWTVTLDGSYAISRLIIQADNNDSFRVDWWDGSGWQLAYDVPVLPSFGVTTRDSGLFTPIITNSFRVSGVSGDGYFSLAEFEAYGEAVGGAIPEPASWAMLIAGFGLVGAVRRRRRRVVAA